jgi:V-type H+-transporting ATPase subunit C
MRYNSGRPLVEIAGQISDLMKKIDNDVKKQQDELTELRNQHAQLVKKEGNNFMTQDISEVIYSYDKLKVNEIFIEKAGGSTTGPSMFQTVIAIVHRTKIEHFQQSYELVFEWEVGSIDFTVIPRSAKYTGIEDKDGYQLWRIVVLRDRTQDYIKKSKEKGLFLRAFDYNYEKYQEELKERTRLEHAIDLAKNRLATKSFFAFSELYIALIHLKVMRAFIDGVLRFGIPAVFSLAIVHPLKGQDKAILNNLNDRFADR